MLFWKVVIVALAVAVVRLYFWTEYLAKSYNDRRLIMNAEIVKLRGTVEDLENRIGVVGHQHGTP